MAKRKPQRMVDRLLDRAARAAQQLRREDVDVAEIEARIRAAQRQLLAADEAAAEMTAAEAVVVANALRDALGSAPREAPPSEQRLPSVASERPPAPVRVSRVARPVKADAPALMHTIADQVRSQLSGILSEEIENQVQDAAADAVEAAKDDIEATGRRAAEDICRHLLQSDTRTREDELYALLDSPQFAVRVTALCRNALPGVVDEMRVRQVVRDAVAHAMHGNEWQDSIQQGVQQALKDHRELGEADVVRILNARIRESLGRRNLRDGIQMLAREQVQTALSKQEASAVAEARKQANEALHQALPRLLRSEAAESTIATLAHRVTHDVLREARPGLSAEQVAEMATAAAEAAVADRFSEQGEARQLIENQVQQATSRAAEKLQQSLPDLDALRREYRQAIKDALADQADSLEFESQVREIARETTHDEAPDIVDRVVFAANLLSTAEAKRIMDEAVQAHATAVDQRLNELEQRSQAASRIPRIRTRTPPFSKKAPPIKAPVEATTEAPATSKAAASPSSEAAAPKRSGSTRSPQQPPRRKRAGIAPAANKPAQKLQSRKKPAAQATRSKPATPGKAKAGKPATAKAPSANRSSTAKPSGVRKPDKNKKVGKRGTNTPTNQGKAAPKSVRSGKASATSSTGTDGIQKRRGKQPSKRRGTRCSLGHGNKGASSGS